MEDKLRSIISSILGLGLLVGLIGLGVYFFAFGHTFDGEIQLSSKTNQAPNIGLVTFQSRFKNRRFLTHSVYLDLDQDTPTTYQGTEMTAQDAVERFSNTKIEARVGYREQKAGWGYVVSLDLEPPGSSPKEVLLITSLLLIFGCTGGMAVIGNSE
jgi:hypothetical protein